MAGPLTIQQVPKGLLDYLGMKGSGQLPTDLAAELRGVIDTSALYLLDRQRIVVGAVAFAVAGTFQFPAAGFVVPAGELWVVNQLTVTVANGATSAGDKGTYIPSIFKPVNAATWQYKDLEISQDFNSGKISDSAGMSFLPFQCVLTPGDAFWGTARNVQLTANASFALTLSYYRLTA